MLAGATIQNRATEPRRRRPARCRATASGGPRSIVRPSVHRLSASCDINVLLFATQVKQLQTPLQTADPALKLEVIFCVQCVISPILANLFMHYTFDLWMARTFPELLWCRYADDGLVHCRVEHEAERVKAALQARLAECHLEMHPTKTRIVYCKDGKRKGKYPSIKFDFLGYCFRPRRVRNSRDNSLFCRFTPAVSPSALKSMRTKIRELGLRRRTELSLAELAHRMNPLLRGWINYYGRYAPSALAPLLRYVNQTLLAWARRKFKRFKAHKVRASRFLQKLCRQSAHLFVHWRIGMTGTFA